MNTGQYIYTVLKLYVLSVNLCVEQEHSNGFDDNKSGIALYCNIAWIPEFLHWLALHTYAILEWAYAKLSEYSVVIHYAL